MAASNLLVDGTVDFTRREYYTSQVAAAPPIPNEFVHISATQPTPPAFPGALSGPEQAQVNAWMDGMTTPTLAGAITWVTAYETFNAANDAWLISDIVARNAQWQILYGDGLYYNKGTTSPSADTGGTGGSPPPPKVGPRLDP